MHFAHDVLPCQAGISADTSVIAAAVMSLAGAYTADSPGMGDPAGRRFIADLACQGAGPGWTAPGGVRTLCWLAGGERGVLRAGLHRGPEPEAAGHRPAANREPAPAADVPVPPARRPHG